MQTKGLISTVVVSLALLFQGCNQEASSSKRTRTGGNSGDAIVAAKQMNGDVAGKGNDDNNGKGNDGNNGKGNDDNNGKGNDDKDKDNDSPAKPDDNGKGNDDKGGKDNDDDKGGNDDTPAQNPGQNPGGKDDEPVDIPPVDIPKKACVYFDPDMPEFTLKKDQFGANLPPIDVPSHLIKGDIQADDATYIGSFTVFQEKRGSANWMSKWDGKAGRIPHDYTMVVVNSTDDSCTAYVRFVQQLPRTNNGCFAQHTKIRMFDGTDRVIAMISAGDMVLNPVTKKAQKVAEVRKGKEAKPMYEIAFGGHSVMVTDTHPMPVRGGIKMAKDVTTSDYLFDANGIIHKVTVAKKLPANKDQVVVNIRLESESSDPMQHMVLADGIVSGDLFLQRRLENPNMTAAN